MKCSPSLSTSFPYNTNLILHGITRNLPGLVRENNILHSDFSVSLALPRHVKLLKFLLGVLGHETSQIDSCAWNLMLEGMKEGEVAFQETLSLLCFLFQKKNIFELFPSSSASLKLLSTKTVRFLWRNLKEALMTQEDMDAKPTFRYWILLQRNSRLMNLIHAFESNS